MKRNIYLLVLVFILNTIGVYANVFVRELTSIKVVEFEGAGKAGKSNIKALKQSDAYDEARKNAQSQLATYIKGIKNTENETLEELSQNSLSMQKLFSDTIKASKITYKAWDKEDNATVKIQLDLIKLKEKLDELGVK